MSESQTPLDGSSERQIVELEASARRAREVAENLEASIERIRAAKRQKIDCEQADLDSARNAPDASAHGGNNVSLPLASATRPPTPRVDDRKPASVPPTTENEEPSYILSHSGARTSKTPEGTTWGEVLDGSSFISKKDIGVAPDAVVISLAQFQKCLLAKGDRIGRYKHQDIGYVGLSCKYCFGQPGYGRFFPSTSSSFISSFPQTAVKHVYEDCLGTPSWIKDVVEQTNARGQRSVPLSASHFGSKGLMERIWALLRSPETDDIIADDPMKAHRVLSMRVDEKDEDSMTWRDVLGTNGLVEISEQYLVPASLFIAVAQYEICEANEFDCRNIGRNRPSINPGYPGICCKFCKGETTPVLPGARIFPAQSGSLAQIDTCGKLQAHIEHGRCRKVPNGILLAIKSAREREEKETRRYGSRKIFFGKVWERLRGLEASEPVSDASQTQVVEDDGPLPMGISELAQGSVLVNSDMDRAMVSDAHLVAFAQMEPCTLTSEDRCGWYKDRDIGFPGVCCKHCKGRPSSGRYFPKYGDFFLRSSKQSIIKHLIENCAGCPEKVRESLRELQRRDDKRKGWKITNKSVLGQGKLFHERVWARLYTSLGVQSIYPMPPPEPTPNPSVRLPAAAAAKEEDFAPAQSVPTPTILPPQLGGMSRQIAPDLEQSKDSIKEPLAQTAKATNSKAEDHVSMPVQSDSTPTTVKLVVDADSAKVTGQPALVRDGHHPESVDRDWVMSQCVYHCRSDEEIREVMDSDELRRIFDRLGKFHQNFIDMFRMMHPKEDLHGEIGFQALHNWYAAWARKVRVGDAGAFKLTLDRRASRSFLFTVYDRQRDGNLTRDMISCTKLADWITRVAVLVLPFERAECLFAMRGANSRHYGLLWASKLPNHRWIVEAEKNAGKPAMNWRFVQIAIDLKGGHADRSRIVTTDAMELFDKLTSPTSPADFPEEIERAEFSVLDLPNDMYVGNTWLIHPREEVLAFIDKASVIEHFVFVYKSESFTNMLRVLRTAPLQLDREDIEMFLALYRKLFACLKDDKNTSVTRESILDRFKIQSISNVLDKVLPVVRQNSAAWPPGWLRGLCGEFGLNRLLVEVGP